MSWNKMWDQDNYKKERMTLSTAQIYALYFLIYPNSVLAHMYWFSTCDQNYVCFFIHAEN